MRRLDLSGFIGQKIARISIDSVVRVDGRTYFSCRCDCGNEKSIPYQGVIRGSVKSCGCLRSEVNHGESGSPEYVSYRKMVERCYNSRDISFCSHGARGVTVFGLWLRRGGFGRFLSYVGPRPTPGHSIDRFPNNNGNYEPGNVRWATKAQQNRNTRKSLRFVVCGVESSLGDLCDKYGKPRGVVYQRVSTLGWDIVRALETPTRRITRIQ